VVIELGVGEGSLELVRYQKSTCGQRVTVVAVISAQSGQQVSQRRMPVELAARLHDFFQMQL